MKRLEDIEAVRIVELYLDAKSACFIFGLGETKTHYPTVSAKRSEDLGARVGVAFA